MRPLSNGEDAISTLVMLKYTMEEPASSVLFEFNNKVMDTG